MNFMKINSPLLLEIQLGFNKWGPRIRRWDGKIAINAIVNDTTLTTGAYFGFGHWNAGEHGRSRTPLWRASLS